MNKPPKVAFDSMNLSDFGYVARGKRWSVLDLIEAVNEQKLKPFTVPLATIDLTPNMWSIGDMDDFISHALRVQKCDLEHPVIYDVYGCLCDGWHRVARAIMEGRTTIQAVRLRTMPTHTLIPEKTL